MDYSISKSMTLSQIETRIMDCFYTAKICHYTSKQFNELLLERVIKPLAYRTPSGRAKHSAYLQGYASGIIARLRSEIWRYHVEFCYLVEGELFSTWKNSTRRKSQEFYDNGQGIKLTNAPSCHYWIGTDKPY